MQMCSTETQAFHNAWPIRLEQDIGKTHQFGKTAAAALAFQIETDHLLAGIDLLVERGDAVIIEKDERPHRIAAWRFDLDHVSAEVGEQARRKGTGKILAEIEDPDALESVIKHSSTSSFQ